MATHPVRLMEDHCDAYPAWRELGVTGRVCVHLDAHLDLADDGFSPSLLEQMAAARTADDLRAYQANPRLPWGGYHAGNYLYPAMHDGTVSHLYWVIPPWLPRRAPLLDWVRGELQHWYQVTLDDYASLRVERGRVEGRILGRPFTLCTVDQIPRFEEPVLLDIDVDYFLDHDDTLFAPVDQIVDTVHRRIGVPLATTVSYSVNGGYTPLENRYVGDLLASMLCRPDEANTRAGRAMRRGDELRVQGRCDEALAEYGRALDRDGLFAAPALYKMSLALDEAGRADDARRAMAQAAQLDAHYRPRALDVAFMWFRRRDHARTLEWLTRAREEDPLDTPLTWFIEGLAQVREQNLVPAIGAFERLLDEPALRPSEQAHLSLTLSRTLLKAGRAADATAVARRAVALDPDNGRGHLQLAHGLRGASLLDEAARHYRKAISLAGHTIGTLEAHQALIEIYEASGQQLLAASETRRLMAKDVVGTFSLKAALGRKGSTP